MAESSSTGSHWALFIPFTGISTISSAVTSIAPQRRNSQSTVILRLLFSRRLICTSVVPTFSAKTLAVMLRRSRTSLRLFFMVQCNLRSSLVILHICKYLTNQKGLNELTIKESYISSGKGFVLNANEYSHMQPKIAL